MTETKENTRNLNRNTKNFTFVTREKVNDQEKISYEQFLCKFKDSVSGEELDAFCKTIIENPDLPSHLAGFFLDIEESQVVDFTSFLKIVRKQNNINYVAVDLVLNKFFDMLDFGDYREKSDDQIGLDIYFAQMATFGNVKKDRRLLEEFQSSEANSQIIKLTGFDVITRNYVGSVKNKEEKPVTMIK